MKFPMEKLLTFSCKKWCFKFNNYAKFYLIFLLGILFNSHVLADDYIVVGAGSTEANGIYTEDGTFTSQKGVIRPKYKRLSGGVTYYIYFNEYGTSSNPNKYWNIDNDLDDADVFYYSEDNNLIYPYPPNGGWSNGDVMGVDPNPTVSLYGPEIGVFGNNNEIKDGETIPSTSYFTEYGEIKTNSGSVTKTYIIKSIGSQALSSVSVAISGTDASHFSIVQHPSSSIANGSESTFQIKFEPTGANGLREAIITVSSNDNDEGTYTFAIQGTGNDGKPIVSTDAESVTTKTTVILNGTVNANGEDATVTFDYGTTTAYGNSDTATQSPITTPGEVSVNKTLTGLSENTTYHYRVKAVNADGTSYGADEIFITLTDYKVANAGTTTVNGTYVYEGYINGKAYFKVNGTELYLYWDLENTTGYWNIDNDLDDTNGYIYYTQSSADTPPSTGWDNTSDEATGISPAPNVTKASELVAEIDILGNNIVIADGSTSTSLDNHTNFGSIPISGGSISRIFTIRSVGTTTVALTGTPIVSISGAHFADFSITQPAESSLDAGNSTTFSVAFNPNALGRRTATISIDNNDSNENPYNFVIEGTGNDGKPIVSTSNASDKTKTEVVFNGIVNANNSSTVVTFEYGTTTSYGSTITATQSPLTGYGDNNVSVTATGLDPNTTYHYRVKATNSEGTTNGDDITFTTVADYEVTNAGSVNTRGVYRFAGYFNDKPFFKKTREEYYIYKDAGNDWNIGPDKDWNNAYYYIVDASETVPSTGWIVYGTGSEPLPEVTALTQYGSEIVIKGNSNIIANGDSTPTFSDSTAFGNTNVGGGTITRTFTIENIGWDDLVLTGSSPYVAISGTNAADFSVTTIPSNNIAVSASTIFRITFDPDDPGTRNATLSIANDNEDENPYTFNIQGTGFDAPTDTTNAASSIVQQSATLNGTVNANNLSTAVTFEYGTDTNYGTSVTATESPVGGTSGTTVSKVISGLTPSTTYHYRVVAVNTAGTTNGSDQTFTTLDCINPTAAGTIGNAQSGCMGFDPAAITSLSLPTGHTGTLEYKWQQSTTSASSGFSEIASSNSTIYDPPSLTDTTWYRRLVRVDCEPNWDNAIASNVIQMTVYPSFAAGSISADASICYDSIPANLIGVAPTGGDTPYSYQWIISTDGTNYADVAGATSLNYQAGALTDTTYYRLEQTSASGCGIDTTNAVKITVYPEFVAGTISSNQNICYNTAPAELKGVAPTGGIGPYTYQWQSSTDNSTFSDIPGAESLDYQPGALTDTTYYQLIQSSAAGCGVLNTSKITINVYEPFVVGSISASQSVCLNDIADELVGIAPTGGGGAYAYQWQNSTDGSIFSDIIGANSLNYQPPALTQTTYYRQLQGTDWGCGINSTNFVTITDDFMAPGVQAHSIVFSDIGAAQIEIDWTNGNGSKRAVFMKEGTTGTPNPENYTTYTANTHFKKGSQIGVSGWYCVSNGTADSVIVNGLMPNTTYRVMVCEYNKDSGCEKYLTTESTSNAANQLTKNIMINEVDADTPGIDTQEFIELFDGGAGTTSLDGLILIHFNGSDDQSVDFGGSVYAIDLNGYTTDSDGYFLIGNSGVNGVDIVFTNDNLQNGPDAVALYSDSASNFPNDTPVTTNYLIDALVYDTHDGVDAGLLVLLNAGQPQVDENDNGYQDLYSNQRIPNGSGGHRNTSTYTQQYPTPGEMNGNPKMQVLGNTQIIVHDDTTPEVADHTDFENTEIFTGSVTRTFTIRNVGEKQLELSSDSIKVTVEGADAADFKVSVQPTTLIAIDSATTNFSIVFDPTTPGTKTTTVNIRNNDRETDSIYKLDIKGTGITAPEIVISGNSIEITDGETIPSFADSTDFGIALVSTETITKTFTITNPGSGTLDLDGTPIVVIGGTHSSDFTVTVMPSTSLTAGATTTFKVQFDPSASGLRTANISIDNNDSDEDPYNFNIQGSGSAVPVVSTDAATAVAQQSATLHGTVNPNSANTIVTFEYGLTSAYGTTVTADQSPITGNIDVSVSDTLSGLIPSTTYHYRVVAENSSGSSEGSDMTFTTLDCIMPTSAGTIGNAQQSCTAFDPEIITSLSLPSGNTGTLEYKWQQSTTSSTEGFTDIDNSNSETYDPPFINDTTWYKRLVRVNCVSDWTGTIKSNVVEMTIYPKLIAGDLTSNQYLCYNTVPSKLVGIAPTGGLAPYTYQWQNSADLTNFNDIIGETTLEYQPSALTETTYFKLLQTSSFGCGTVSNIVRVMIFDEFKVGSISETQVISYRSLPEKLIGVPPTGGNEPYVYQWQQSSDGTNFSDISGADELDYQAGRLSRTTHFRLKQGSASGCGMEFTNTAIIIVFPEFKAGSIAEDQQIAYGSIPEKLTATEPTGGNIPYTYQWQQSLDGVTFVDIAGATDINYQPEALTTQTYFRQIQTSSSICGSVETNVLVINIQGQPTVDIALEQAVVCPYSGHQLNATAQNYEIVTWTSLGDGIFNDVNILNPIYTPGDIDIANGSVTLAISAIANSPLEMMASDQIVLSFFDTPVIDVGDDLTVYQNSEIQLSATVNGNGSYTYAWSPAEMVSDPTILNPVTDPITQTTTFSLIVKDIATGCEVEDQVTFKVEAGVFYQISGQVRSIGLKNSLPATNIYFTGIDQSTSTNDQGEYVMQVPAGYTGWGIPSRAGFAFEPDSVAFQNVSKNIIATNIAGTIYIRAVADHDSIVAGQSVKLSVELINPSSAITTCSWQDETGEFCTEVNAVVEPTQTTLYKVIVRDAYECTFDTVRVYVSETVGIDDLTTNEGLISLYPNPTKNIINLELSGELDAQLISIINPDGTLVRQIKLPKSFTDHKIQINLEHLIDGSYYIIITNGNGELIGSKKVVKI